MAVMPDSFRGNPSTKPSCLRGRLVLILAAASVFLVWTPGELVAAELPALVEESPLVLPAPPADAALLPFYVSATSAYQFAIDASSLSVPQAGVVHYTVVIDSPGGARTVSYEGMRCASGQYRRYAVGRRDGQWSLLKQSLWEMIDATKVVNRYHAALYYDHFCRDGLPSHSAAEARASLQQAAKR